MVRAQNDGDQFERCVLAGQSFSFTTVFLNILSENVLFCRILAVVCWRCWYAEAGNVSQRWQTPVKGGGGLRKEFCKVSSFYQSV